MWPVPIQACQDTGKGKTKKQRLCPKKPATTDDTALEADTEGKYIPSKRTATIFVGKKSGVEIRKEN